MRSAPGLAAALAVLAFGLALAAGADDRADDRGDAVAPQEPVWLVGDLHVHVSPPDAEGHAALTVESAIDLARDAGLDFVALTPHTGRDPTGPDGDESGQAWVTRHAALALRPLEGDPGGRAPAPVVVAGWEFTRDDPGHLVVTFTDVTKLPPGDGADVSAAAVSAGALVTVAHPFFRPIATDHPLAQRIDADRSWRPFTQGGAAAGHGQERWNAIEIWHDRSALVERLHRPRKTPTPGASMVRDALDVWDRTTREERRRIVAVGGSDAHGRLPYTVAPLAVVSVRTAARTEAALREGLLAARVTFGPRGGVAARGFRAESDVRGERAGIGDALRAESWVQLTWDGPAELVENGERVGTFDGGTRRTLPTRGAFAFWRIECPGDAYSNMIYANLRD